jgi:outer membrane lipoprotein-sorting protein
MSARIIASLAAFACIVLGSQLGCADDFMLERTQKNLARMRSFHGILVENGVLASGEMRSEVLWKRPHQFISRVLSPASYAGVTLAYDGAKLTIYYPQANYAIEFDGLIPPTAEEEHRLIADAYHHNQNAFRYSLGGSGSVAGLPVVTLNYKAKQKAYVSPWGSAQVYDKYSFSLAGVMQFSNDAQYEFRFTEMKFDETVDDARFVVPLPKNVILSRWDMSSIGIPEREMREQANFAVPSLPVPEGFRLERIVRQEGALPAFTVIYRRGAQFVLLSMWKDIGLTPTSEAHGVPVSLGDKAGHLVLSPSMSSYTFSQHGTMCVLTSNLPFDQLLTVAADIH